METTTIDNDIKVFYVPATSFPDGVMAAHKKIHSLAPFSAGRKYFGLSRPETGVIAYKAAAEESFDGEGASLNCDSLVLKKGKYVSTIIKDFMSNMPAIGAAFRQLLSNPEIDPNGYCVEWYFNDTDLQCMVRLQD